MATDFSSFGEQFVADEGLVAAEPATPGEAAIILAQTPADPAGGQPAGQQPPENLPDTVSPDANTT